MTLITAGTYLKEAILKAKSAPPNADGTIGAVLTSDSPTWKAWLAYFYGKRMDAMAGVMRNQFRKGFSAPCADPADFDPDIAKVREEYAFRLHRGEIPGDARPGKMAWEIPAEEVAALIAEKVGALTTKPQAHRYRSPDMREPKTHKPAEPRDLTEAEADSMRRLMGISDDKRANP